MDGVNSFSVIILEGADSDIEQIIDWYESQKTGLGFEFYQTFLNSYLIFFCIFVSRTLFICPKSKPTSFSLRCFLCN